MSNFVIFFTKTILFFFLELDTDIHESFWEHVKKNKNSTILTIFQNVCNTAYYLYLLFQLGRYAFYFFL